VQPRRWPGRRRRTARHLTQQFDLAALNASFSQHFSRSRDDDRLPGSTEAVQKREGI
jgi:hypothetical protein